MVNLLLTQHNCFWDCHARDKHWVQRDCKKIVDAKNVINIHHTCSTRDSRFPPLHIKPGLMKQFVKLVDKGSACFKHLCK